jgi:exonuclease SbcC
MLIQRIELSNFKSFASAEIELAPGLTAIVGDNGAGKTAILEAIGLGLFDSRPSRLATLMRHGAADTVVTIEFTSSLDQRSYRVTRSLHRSRTRATGALSASVQMDSEIFDVEQETVFERRAAEVESFLAQHLGVDGFAGPSDVFEHVVGVSQGRLTADFLDAPRLRQERFDPILRTDEFKRAADDLLVLVHQFDRRHVAHESSAAELQRQIQRRPSAEAELAEARRKASEIAKGQTAAQGDLVRAQVIVQEHDKCLVAADAASKAAELADVQVESAQIAANEARGRLRDAEDARHVLDETREDHEAFSRAQAEMEGLTDIRSEKDVLSEKLILVQESETQAAFALEQAQQALAEAEATAGSMALLAVAAEVESSTSERLRELRTKHAVSLVTADRSTRAERDVAEARNAVGDGIRGLDDEAEALAATAIRLEDEWSVASALRPVIGQLRNRRDSLHELRARRSVVAAVMEADSEAAALLADACTCPFFESECLNLSDVPDVGLVFERRASGHRDRLGELDAGEAQAEAALLEAEEAERQAGDLTARRQTLDAARKAHAESISKRDLLRAVETSASGDDATALGVAIEALPNDLYAEAAVSPARYLVAALVSLAEARDAATEAQRLVDEIETVEQELGPHIGAGEAMRQAQPIAGERDARRTACQQAEAVAVATASAKAEVERELRMIAPRLTELQAAQQALDRARPGHERFLRHERLAAETEACSARSDDADVQARKAIASAEQARAQAGKLRTLADPEARTAAHAARDTAIAYATELDTRAESIRARIDDQLSALKELKEKEQRLKSERAGATRSMELKVRTEFMRSVLRDAGPLVAEALLGDVSEAADEIFGEVLGDHAGRLRWTADYDILLERDGHERRFAQLSGGEQMTAALSVRLALLRELLNLDIAFFDEPTQNLDDVRRANLAEQILRVRGFEQLVVITHDDTFERVLDNVIQVRKVGGESVVEST